MSRRKKDLAAMAAFAASMYGLNEARKVNKSLGQMEYDKKAEGFGYPVDKNPLSARTNKTDLLAADRKLTPDETAEIKRRVDFEEKNPDVFEPTKGRESFDWKTAPKRKAKGGAVKSSASKRADGIAQRGKTKGRMV